MLPTTEQSDSIVVDDEPAITDIDDTVENKSMPETKLLFPMYNLLQKG